MDTQVIYERASLLYNQGRIEEAIREIRSLLELEPRDADGLCLYARCLLDKADFDGALELLDQAISAEPNNSYCFYLKGFACYRKDENQSAIGWLNTSISMEPRRPAAYGLLALVYVEERQFTLALDKANEGLAIDPDDLTCLNARATALNKLKQTDAAIETMNQALARDPDNEFTHSTIGWNLLEKGRHQEARGHFREALRLHPNYANAQAGLKESLKSRIPPYRWLLQYSFWVSNQGKKAGWIIPLAIFAVVRIISSSTKGSESTSLIGMLVVGFYLVFVVATWILNPVANFFLLFHRDGKYALNLTEKWGAITVVSAILAGLVFLLAGWLQNSTEDFPALYIVAFSLLLLAVPLGEIQYPLALRGNSARQLVSLVLVALGLSTIIASIFSTPAALILGAIFLVLFVLNNWFGLFMVMRRK